MLISYTRLADLVMKLFAHSDPSDWITTNRNSVIDFTRFDSPRFVTFRSFAFRLLLGSLSITFKLSTILIVHPIYRATEDHKLMPLWPGSIWLRLCEPRGVENLSPFSCLHSFFASLCSLNLKSSEVCLFSHTFGLKKS